jgi:NADH-quinone oxidoreductase subunit M
MVNHGVSTGALFLMIGLLEERRQSLEIADFGGVAKLAPYLSVAFAATMLASAGLPTLGNFVGEFLILQGAAAAYFPWAVAAALGVILSACYLLWMYQRVFFGETPSSLRIQDLDAREWAATLPLLVLMIWMGVSATGFLAPIGAKNQTLVAPAAPKPIAAQVNAAQVNAGEVSR